MLSRSRRGKAALAKGEVGIRRREPVPTLKEFAERDFLPFVRATFSEKEKTKRDYDLGVRSLLALPKLAASALDEITVDLIAAYAGKRQQDGLKTSSINRELQALRRMFALAHEWGKTEKALCRVRMLPGEAHRERVLTADEQTRYLSAASDLGHEIDHAYGRALHGIRATKHGISPVKPDPFRLRDVAPILMECGLRPEECFRLRWANVQSDFMEVLSGKNGQRETPHSDVTARAGRLGNAAGRRFVGMGVPGANAQRPHRAIVAQKNRIIKLAAYPASAHLNYTRFATPASRDGRLRGMDPWTLAYLAGHGDMSITRRYAHPQSDTIREAIQRARVKTHSYRTVAQGGHKIGHKAEITSAIKRDPDDLIN